MNKFEFGYNRDNDLLPQINMALFHGETSQLPIFHNVNNGSITDKTDLVKVIQHTELLDLNTTRFAIDSRFYSRENITYFFRTAKIFIMGVGNRLLFIKAIISKIINIITGQQYKV